MSYQALYTHDLFKISDRIVLFCNQSSYDFNQRKYLFDVLIDAHKLESILLPEHGLFSEFQDQDNVISSKYRNVTCHSMYSKADNITGPNTRMINNADLLIIDIYDVGVRYFTYTTHMFILLKFVSSFYPDLQVVVIDRPNPLGRKIEGTILDSFYVSFLGPEGMIHRHGLSTGELCEWYMKKEKINLRFIKIPYNSDKYKQFFISPSPNLPSLTSLGIYPGQCFWEATTFSEGRGTSRPFELFGHPELSFKAAENIGIKFNFKYKEKAFLRTTSFIPTFHKHIGKVCFGWQLFIGNPEAYHSLAGTLYIMRQARECLDNASFWREGSYEFDSQASAAQLLLGDNDLISYVDGDLNEETILNKMNQAQLGWSNSL
ncbi:MAG: DUF1343 domain-containing protein [Saprospiraceae bacterium]|jgi:uncharacterized protein YbbC (DUF1343 family)|nr:DUF1343 domain-containing protein [Saprospiraceae bacterium]